jgi:nitronate monooxygenase
MIATRATQALGIEYPVVLAGMGGGTNPELVAAVSEAGGLGILACTWMSADDLAVAVADIRARTSRPFGVNFVLHLVDPPMIDAAIALRVPVLSYFRGDPAGPATKAKAAGLATMHQITTVEDANEAAACGIDVIVAQGREAGGHMGPEPLWTLLPAVVDAIADRPVLAAGGLVDGRDLAAALAMGANGVMMGTRFLASTEAPISARYKQAILDAKAGDTIDSDVWDLLWGADWPGVKVRGFRDQRFDRWIGRRAELDAAIEAARAEFVAARENPDTTVPLLAGEGSARITALKPAAAIVRDVVAEAERALPNATAAQPK